MRRLIERGDPNSSKFYRATFSCPTLPAKRILINKLISPNEVYVRTGRVVESRGLCRKQYYIEGIARHSCTAFLVPVSGGELDGRHEIFDGG